MTNCRCPNRTLQSKKQGIALLAVLWMVAALSIMLAGLQQVVRGEVRIAGQVRTNAVSTGIADAAILLTLQALDVDKGRPIKSVQTKSVSVFGTEITVQTIPMNGLIDLNNASESLLSDAFRYGGEVAEQEAQRLAKAVVAARIVGGSRNASTQFHATEDLLRVVGLDYNVYARLKNCLTVDIVGSGRVNPLAASLRTLVVLTKGDHARAQQLFDARLSSPESMDTTSLTAAHLEMSPTNSLLVSAKIATQQETRLVRNWRVRLFSPAFGLPWRVLGVDAITAE